MAVINTGLVLKGARSEFFDGLKSVPPAYKDLCTIINSTADVERYRWLGSTAQMRQWIGPRQAQPLYPETYDVANLKYEVTMEVDRTELEDDQTGQILVRARGMGINAGQFKDHIMADLLVSNAVAIAAGGTGAYDSAIVPAAPVPYFAATHTCRATGAATMTNLSTSAAVTATQPTTAEMITGIQTAVGAMRVLLNDQGEPIYVGGTGFKLIVPPVYEFPAREALQAQMLLGTNNIMSGFADIIVCPWLASVAIMYLAYTAGPVRPFIYQQRTPLEFVAKDRPDDDNTFTDDKYYYGARERFRIANGEWRYCIQHTFT
jgi:phage major head subunit gpT-like protein